MSRQREFSDGGGVPTPFGDADTEPRPPAPEGDDAIRAIVKRLSRPAPAGASVIERAAILAEGADSGRIITWILAHAGRPEALAPQAPPRGLHGGRSSNRAAALPPRRYLLPAGALTEQRD
jgi:hypothetical protein